MEIAIREGWKQQDNNRFGECMEIRFINTTDGKIMFRYAPFLADKGFWEDVFKKLEAYDSLHKQIFSLVKTIDGEGTISMGSCKNE